MRNLYLVSTALFWLLVTAFWAASLSLPAAETNRAVTAETSYGKADLARHATAEDCWMAIRGGVYNLTAYLPEHPARLELVVPWCGKEATDAYNTKTKGRPHAPYADELLANYKIGKQAPDGQ